MTANPKVAHYPENMHITPVSSGLRRLLAPALLLALPVLMTACGGGKATRPAPPPPTANWPKTVPDNPEAANSVLMRAISLVGTPTAMAATPRIPASTAAAWWPMSIARCWT